ncbi:MAG: outer membrane beta-barrel protein [Taibaiella sp.]|nr:outer membrane beta-barrel protein [Taibaiella sp.]
MRKIYLTGLILGCTVITNAQNIEIGAAGGISINGIANGNMVYTAEKPVINYAASGIVMYNFADHMQAGLEGHALALSGTSDKVYMGPNGSPIGGANKRYVYSELDASLCAVFNGRINFGNGYVYAGPAVGYNIARNHSKTYADNDAYKAPDGGQGIVFGAQGGYVRGLSDRFGLYAEIAIRYYDLKYTAEAPNVHPQSELHYHLLAYPLVVGVRYRLFKSKIENDIPGLSGNGRSK